MENENEDMELNEEAIENLQNYVNKYILKIKKDHFKINKNIYIEHNVILDIDE